MKKQKNTSEIKEKKIRNLKRSRARGIEYEQRIAKELRELGFDVCTSRSESKAMDDKKAEDIKVIDISEVSVLADYFIIAGGSNASQIQALCNNVDEKLGRAGHPSKQIEGYDTANWVLLDFGDIIVHIFDKENRLLYDLERIWRDGKLVDVEQI